MFLPNPTSKTSAFDELVERAVDAMQQAGEAMVADVRESINEAYPPSSAIGTPPHRRTGNLRNHVGSETAVAGDVITTTLSSAAHYSAYLEPTRPFMKPARDEWDGKISEFVSSRI